ncbi:MAG: ABC transporter substrate-binding protein [Alphaproteobacteria bacterium]|nr:ABC transporter substrate-binding protein [Alphaproteobacteria bacterium]
MFKLRTNSGRPVHPDVPQVTDLFLKGEIDRRAFLRTVTLLGVSASSAFAVTGATPAGAQETPKKGGALRYGSAVMEINDPMMITWTQPSNVLRNVVEYLTRVDEDNMTLPSLAASWDPSADLTTWKFKLQPNVKWSNGDAFTTEDVAFNIRRWIAPESKSSNKSAFSAVKDVEIVNDLEFTLHLSRPTLAIPEMLFAYTCPILHRKFVEQGGVWTKNPIGTGPYSLVEFAVGQKATLRRRDGYWGKAPHLDEIRFIDLGTDVSASIQALASNQVDLVPAINTTDIDVVKRLPNVTLLSGRAAQTICIRMQGTQKPFDDIRVRKAMVLASDNQKMLELGYRGLGVVAENHHVAPFHPEYFKLPPLKRDVAQAKALLAEAGYKDGLDVALTLGNTQGRWEQDTAQIMQQQVAEAGIRMRLDVKPASEFWPIWDKVPFGLTFWAHRPLAVMTLDLAYRAGGSWNESRYASAEFDAALNKATGIVDPKARSQAMESVERILQDAAVMVQPYWADRFGAMSNKVRGFRLHPATYNNLTGAWLA